MDYLFDRVEKVLAQLKRAKRLFFFLDYDGTLTPIVSHPDEAILSEKMKTILLTLKKNPKFFLAIASGRSIKDVRDLVGLKKIYYIGNHGLEISTPSKGIKQFISKEVRLELARIRNRLSHQLKNIDGLILEDKGCILSIHYRNVDSQKVPPILMVAKKEIKDSGVPLCLGYGKMVFEIRPESNVNKGTAVLELLNQVGQSGMLPLYIGDDLTDEDAFQALNKKGITIFVGLPMDSSAQYYVEDSSEVYQFLKIITEGLG